MSKYKVGSVVSGTVIGIESYGVFVNLDAYYSGLIHISEISHSFVKNINDYVEIGQTIRVKILEVDDDLFQVKLSIKDINHKLVRKKKEKIVEVGSGFDILRKNLNNWIKIKTDELKIKKS